MCDCFYIYLHLFICNIYIHTHKTNLRLTPKQNTHTPQTNTPNTGAHPRRGGARLLPRVAGAGPGSGGGGGPFHQGRATVVCGYIIICYVCVYIHPQCTHHHHRPQQPPTKINKNQAPDRGEHRGQARGIPEPAAAVRLALLRHHLCCRRQWWVYIIYMYIYYTCMYVCVYMCVDVLMT